MKPPLRGGSRELWGVQERFRTVYDYSPSSVVSNSVLMDQNRGSSGSTERAVADQLSSCFELCLMVSKI
jgi:hypothetical protein